MQGDARQQMCTHAETTEHLISAHDDIKIAS